MIIYPEKDFARAVPESQGLRSQAISAMLADIQRTGTDFHSLLIMRHGRLVFERYFGLYTAETPHAMYSCSKTFTSMLIGIAQDKGLLNIHDRVLKYFPEYEEGANDNMRAMTIESLLMMGSGHAEDTFPAMVGAGFGEGADWVKAFFACDVKYKPGTFFMYNTGATYMLSAILTKVTGRPALDLANEWLFGPLGISGATWDACPRGINLGGTGLHIRPRDMLRMGMMLMAHGRWKDKRIVSAEYIAQATRKHIENRTADPNQDPNWASGYCYQIWRCAFGAFRADGMGGQYIVCVPDKDLICVVTSALGGDIGMGYALDLIDKYILPGCYDQAQVEDPDAYAALMAYEEPEPQPKPEGLSYPFGQTIAFDDNEWGYESLTVDDEKIALISKEENLILPYGWGRPMLGEGKFTAIDRPTALTCVSGLAQTCGDGLKLTAQYFGEPQTRTITVTPNGGAYDVVIHATLGPKAVLKGHIS